jgi:hypothetical protein
MENVAELLIQPWDEALAGRLRSRLATANRRITDIPGGRRFVGLASDEYREVSDALKILTMGYFLERGIIQISVVEIKPVLCDQ